MVSLRARLALGAGYVAIAIVMMGLGSGSSRAEGAPAGSRDYVGEWLTRQGEVRTWSANFVQTRSLKTLTQPVKTEGRVWFAAPDRFRWELGRPAQTLAVRQSDAVVVHYPRLKRAERYPVTEGSTGPWSQMLSLLEAGFPKGRKDLDDRFTVASETVTNGVVDVALRPKAASVRRMLPLFRVVLSAEDATLRATELVFADGSSLRNDFTETQVNPPIDDGMFQLELGPDVKVTEPLTPKRR